MPNGSRRPRRGRLVAALRWAQAQVLGASDELTRALLETSLARVLDREDFWETVVQFFVNHPELPVVHVGPIVDFLRARRCDEPELTMRGRSPAGLLRLVHAWHGELALRKQASISWAAAPFGGLRWLERVRPQGEDDEVEVRIWTLAELCTSADLLAEGRAMRHCVATYVPYCQSGRRSIWSMQVETPRGTQRVLTIEIDRSTRRIIQARRKCNGMPRADERAVMLRWAAREGLGVVESLRA